MAEKLHLINWKMVTREKNEGGLGIRSPKAKNMVLLTTLAWIPVRNPSTPWAQTITAKYAKNKSLAFTSFIRKSLLKGWNVCNAGILWHLCKNSKINIWYSNLIYNSNTLRTSIEVPLSKND
ncbi:uncharacterized protein [Nicotiana sylvestris]|uniref:uncharacterized protein n=1 Tax=Nicotiana sylvestris TaxID=4096 RepID=UPI00388C3D27